MYNLILNHDAYNSYGIIKCIEADKDNNINIFKVHNTMKNQITFCCNDKHAQKIVLDTINQAKIEIEKRRGKKSNFIIEGNNIIFE